MSEPKPQPEQLVVPVIEEELVTSKKIIKTGSVRVEKRVERHVETVSMPMLRHTVDIKRVAMNQEITTIPETRVVGATTIIPVVEEEFVVTKRLILKEEIHLTKHFSSEEKTLQIPVGAETAEILRLDAEGRVIESQSPRRIVKRRSVKTG